MFSIIEPRIYYNLSTIDRREHLGSKAEYSNFYDWLSVVVEEVIEDVEHQKMYYLQDAIRDLKIKLNENYNKKII